MAIFTRPGCVCLKAIFCTLLILPATAQESSPRVIPRCLDSGFKQPDHIVLPKYPKGVDVGGETVVELRAVVGPDGKLKELTPDEGSNPFVNAAVRAVRRWHFYPVSVDGKVANTTFKLHINFHPLMSEGVLADVDLESPRPEPNYPHEEVQADESLGERIYSAHESGVTAPQAVYKPDPEFTEDARKARESGEVDFVFVVDTDGSPKNIRMTCSSTPAENENALATLKRWKFEPGSKGGTPVPVRLAVQISFHTQ